MISDDHAGGAGVIQVDVAQEQVADVRQGKAEESEAFLESWDARSRTAVEERWPVVGLDEVAADDALDAAVVEVN
jgi:hypothetical protein